jgi:hypothetical protein
MTNLIVRTSNLIVHASRTVLRGELDIESSIASLKRDWYQRKENFSTQKTRQLIADFIAGDEFPDITLGMRGNNWQADADDNVSLCDPIYIIDGLQRWQAALMVFENNPETPIRLGCIVYFDTTPEWEQEQFRRLNTRHSAMAANVILRNEKERNRVAGTLFGVSRNEPAFALNGRVCWDQVMSRVNGGDLITGSTLLNVSIQLHHHIIGKITANAVIERVQALDQKMDTVKLSLQRMRENLILFFDFIDAAWSVRTPGLTIKSSPHLLAGWLTTVARILSDHHEFWRNDDRNDDQLFVPLPYIRDFKRIDPTDIDLRRLAGGNQNTRTILYNTIIDRLNKGKSSNRLINRLTRQKLQEEGHG